MKRFSSLLIITSAIMLLSSCEVIGGIFKAGVWSGIIMVVIVLVLIIWLLSKLMGGKRD